MANKSTSKKSVTTPSPKGRTKATKATTTATSTAKTAKATSAAKPAKPAKPAKAPPAPAPPPKPKHALQRADYGKPVAEFFAKVPSPMREIAIALRDLATKAAPNARSQMKWGMPFYAIGEEMICAIGVHAGHVNLILPGPPETYADPNGRLAGEGETGKHLKLTTLDDLDRAEVRSWLAIAVSRVS